MRLERSVKIIPSIDLQSGRSRLVLWPGAATGEGSPTDRPEKIATHFVSLGAPMLHLVDLDGAQRGAPVNTEAIQRISRDVAVPLQLAGGVDGPEQIELAFACGATRVVVPLWVVAEYVSRRCARACASPATGWRSASTRVRIGWRPIRGTAARADISNELVSDAGVRRRPATSSCRIGTSTRQQSVVERDPEARP